jgi:hypothetical protein
MLGVEKKIGGRTLKHPLRRGRWVSVEVDPDFEESSVIELRKGAAVIEIKKRPWRNVHAITYFRRGASNTEPAIMAFDHEINEKRKPWNRKIRYRIDPK